MSLSKKLENAEGSRGSSGRVELRRAGAEPLAQQQQPQQDSQGRPRDGMKSKVCQLQWGRGKCCTGMEERLRSTGEGGGKQEVAEETLMRRRSY